MTQHSCDLCNNPAVIHDTLSQGGVVTVQHLCRAHGLQTWRQSLPAAGVAPAALSKDPVFQALAAEAGKQLHRRGGSLPST